MVNARYLPKLRYGILKNKRIILIKKNLKKLKNKKKWFRLVKFRNHPPRWKFVEKLLRNDTHLCAERKKLHTGRFFDLQKEYTHTFFSIRQLATYLLLKAKILRTFFSQVPKTDKKVSTKSFFDFIETRLDVLLLRINFVSSLYHARWLISSGFVYINNALFRVASYRVHIGDSVRVSKLFFLKKYFFNTSTFSFPAEYLEINYNLLRVVIIQIPQCLKENEIVKQYSFFFFLCRILLIFQKNKKKLYLITFCGNLILN
jgi:ribosomal protein S4